MDSKVFDNLVNQPEIEFHHGIFYDRKNSGDNRFTIIYEELRKKEGRIYTDIEVARLPEISPLHRYSGEWRIRKSSSQMLIKHLLNKSVDSILDLGCGNGWLSNYLAKALNSMTYGADIYEKDLMRAAQIFNNKQLIFIHTYSIESIFSQPTFDVIVLASSIPYFKSLSGLIHKLLPMLNPDGEIHILDSPLCRSHEEAAQKQKRTDDYFLSLNLPEMRGQFHYHSIYDLKEFQFKMMHDSFRWWTRVSRRFGSAQSPFPWVMVKGEKV